jgi:hypothetical protein
LADTTKELVLMLETALEGAHSFEIKLKIERILDKAKTGYYHDYKSPINFPKLQLVDDLVGAGLEELADIVMRGEFDENTDDVEQVLLRGRIHRT